MNPPAFPRRLAAGLTLIAAALAGAGCADLSHRADARTATMGIAPTAVMAAAPRAFPAATDADMQSVLDALAGLHPKTIESLTPQEARRQPTPADAVKVVLRQQGRSTEAEKLVPGVHSVDRSIPGPAGAIPARIYTPEGKGPFPVVVYYHGGGWVIADKEVYDGGARGLSKEARAIVVSIDYRLAPEHKMPAQWDDSLAAYRWAVEHAAAIGGDPHRIALAGESAGGNLAVATAMAARDARLPLPVHVVSVYPIAQSRLDTPAYRQFAEAKPLNRPMMQWFFGHTIRTQADLQDPRIDLVHARLQGLPPVSIVNAGIDPLRSDGEMLENALRAAGVPVQRRVWEGSTHEFFGMAAVVQDAREAQAWTGQRLREAFEAG